MTETTLPQYTGQPAIVEFLRARYDERERGEMVRLHGSVKIQVAAHPSQRTGDRLVTCHDCDWFTEGPAGETSAAIAQHLHDEHDDMRVLADLASKRAIIEYAQTWLHLVVEGDCWFTCPAATEERDGGESCNDDERGKPCDCGAEWRQAKILGHFASVYADHSDYREEWVV